jgi:TPR repeat protein
MQEVRVMVQYAEQGSSIVQYELGQMFQKCSDKFRDYNQAAKWYELSAKHGYRRAQHLLGAMYAQGRGVARNYIKAYAWCKVSESQHSRRAFLKLKKIETYMSREQIAVARKLSRQYYEMYVAPFAH